MCNCACLQDANICLQNHWCKSVFAAELIFRFPHRPGGIHTCTINTVKNFSKMFLLYFFRPCLPFRGRTVQLLKAASLIALDWSISVYGSSRNSLFCSFSIHICLFALGMIISWKRKQKSDNDAVREILTVHELPYTEMVKSGTIRLALAAQNSKWICLFRTVHSTYSGSISQNNFYSYKNFGCGSV